MGITFSTPVDKDIKYLNGLENKLCYVRGESIVGGVYKRKDSKDF